MCSLPELSHIVPAVSGHATKSAAFLPRVEDYSREVIGQKLFSTKTRHSWILSLEGSDSNNSKVHLELLHSRVSGRKRISVDGKEVFHTQHKSFCWSFEHLLSGARVTVCSGGARGTGQNRKGFHVEVLPRSCVSESPSARDLSPVSSMSNESQMLGGSLPTARTPPDVELDHALPNTVGSPRSVRSHIENRSVHDEKFSLLAALAERDARVAELRCRLRQVPSAAEKAKVRPAMVLSASDTLSQTQETPSEQVLPPRNASSQIQEIVSEQVVAGRALGSIGSILSIGIDAPTNDALELKHLLDESELPCRSGNTFHATKDASTYASASDLDCGNYNRLADSLEITRLVGENSSSWSSRKQLQAITTNSTVAPRDYCHSYGQSSGDSTLADSLEITRLVGENSAAWSSRKQLQAITTNSTVAPHDYCHSYGPSSGASTPSFTRGPRLASSDFREQLRASVYDANQHPVQFSVATCGKDSRRNRLVAELPSTGLPHNVSVPLEILCKSRCTLGRKSCGAMTPSTPLRLTTPGPSNVVLTPRTPRLPMTVRSGNSLVTPRTQSGPMTARVQRSALTPRTSLGPMPAHAQTSAPITPSYHLHRRSLPPSFQYCAPVSAVVHPCLGAHPAESSHRDAFRRFPC